MYSKQCLSRWYKINNIWNLSKPRKSNKRINIWNYIKWTFQFSRLTTWIIQDISIFTLLETILGNFNQNESWKMTKDKRQGKSKIERRQRTRSEQIKWKNKFQTYAFLGERKKNRWMPKGILIWQLFYWINNNSLIPSNSVYACPTLPAKHSPHVE